MTLFDFVAAVILAVSALVGFSRGAVRELVNLLSFTFAAVASVFLLPFSGPIARHSLQPNWAGNAAAIVVVFLIAYILFRLLGHWASEALRKQSTLGTLDRTVGLGFGVLRALVLLGVFYLVFNAATPRELVPSWISGGALYPVSRLAGRTLALAAPKGLRAAGSFGHVLGERVKNGVSSEDEASDEVGGIETAPDVPPAAYQPSSGQTSARPRHHRRAHARELLQ